MSKGNLLLGFARGKVGDLVFFRQAGEQITRARNTSPKNPQTALQLLQRVVMKTNAQAFSLLQDICNHSFQGLSGVTPNQSRFARLNVAYLRSYLATEINSGDPGIIAASVKTNFSSKDSSLAQVNPYIISEGTIAPLSYVMDGGTLRLTTGDDPADIPTSYQDVANALGLSRGDQLTFIGLTVDDSRSTGVFNSIKYARVILEPAGGDMSVAFLGTGNVINDPNPRNEGDIRISMSGDASGSYIGVTFPGTSTIAGSANCMAAGAVIASRLSGSIWQRSTQQLALRDAGSFSFEQQVNTLGDAVMSFVSEANSTLYLNQAENF